MSYPGGQEEQRRRSVWMKLSNLGTRYWTELARDRDQLLRMQEAEEHTGLLRQRKQHII